MNERDRGLFISMEGIDGSGKTSQCQLLAEWLKSENLPICMCTDPGSTAIGLELRRLLLHSRSEMAPLTEALLFMASRAELIEQIIKPALQRNEIVLCDRFLLSTVVYQGYGAGLDPDYLWQLGGIAAAGVLPSYTFLFDLPLEIAFRRRGKEPDRMESRALEFHQRVRNGFLTEAYKHPDRIEIIDATNSVDAISEKLKKRFSELLKQSSE